MEVKKVIIPIAGLASRFLPLSLAVPKEFLPLVDKPSIQYLLQEAKESGITEIVFVVSPKQKLVLDYFKKHADVEKSLIARKKDNLLKELLEFESIFENITISFVTQKIPKGDGHAILQAEKFGKNDPVAVLFNDDIIDCQVPALEQLINVFKTCDAPVIGLKKLPRERISAYGSVAFEKIAHGIYKIKKIIEKPKLEEIQSDMVVMGKYILTPEVFEYLKKAKPSEKGEIILAEVFQKMLEDGKTIYGCELKGEWLECGDKLKWIKSFFYMALKDPRYKDELKNYLKTIK
jgi:UTP--glucose-1-phosphate uridylyltransferase